MEWKTTPGLTDYPAALAAMETRVKAIQDGAADELVWLVEHPPIYTLGTSAKREDVLAGDTPTYETGRGGQVTYHGPGQRVVYLMLDLKKRAGLRGAEPDLRAYVQDLERWIIATLDQFGIEGFTRDGRVGVWVDTVRVASHGEPLAAGVSEAKGTRSPSGNIEAKIAALGVRVQKWVTSHGIALNVNPDLSHYTGIVPCGIREYGVTSLHDLGVAVGMAEVDGVLRRMWGEVFIPEL